MVLKSLTSNDKDLLKRVSELFIDLQKHEKKLGLSIDFNEDKIDIWLESLINRLGRISNLLVAINQTNDIVGFVIGSLKILPEYYSPNKIGTIEALYIAEGERGKGIGRDLIVKLNQWFSSRNIKKIEVETVIHNNSAIAFYEKSGFKKEICKLRV